MEYPKTGLKRVFFSRELPVGSSKDTDYWVPEMGTSGRFLDNGVFLVGLKCGRVLTIPAAVVSGWVAVPPAPEEPKPAPKKPAARRRKISAKPSK